MHDDDPLVARLIPPMRLITTIPLEGFAYRQIRKRYRVTGVPTATPRSTRWVVRGDPAALYLSDSEDGAWAELAKHHDGSVELIDLVRLMGTVAYELKVLDLTNRDVLDALKVEPEELVAPTFASCRALATVARYLGIEALISPSAAHPTARTIVVFEGGIAGLTVVSEEVRSPPLP
jgi:RES domain-containing protein